MPVTGNTSHVALVHHFCPTWLQIGGLHNSLLKLYYLLEWHTELRQTLSYVYQFIKGHVMEIDEYPDK